MIAILSPAKNMRQVPAPAGVAATSPRFLEETNALWETLRQMSPWELESWFHVNPQLAMRSACAFQDFDREKEGTPALFAYNGLAYTQLHPADFSAEDVSFCNEHLRILSAFYGLLRPCDGILPYRLEMGCKLRFGGKTLYQFWGDKLYRALFAEGRPVINLASKEYAKAVTPYLTPEDRMITCDFMTVRKGRLTTLATEAKMARGRMVRFLVQERLTKPEQLQNFAWNGYVYVPERSDGTRYVFEK